MINTQTVVHSNPNICGGELVFIGTRVPLRIFIEHREAGVSLDDFLDQFPSVTRAQAETAAQLTETATSHANPS